MILEIFKDALQLILHLDPALCGVIALTLKMAGFSLLIGGSVGIILGAIPVVFRFPGRKFYLILLHAFMGLPPVVVGLVLYLLLSHSGPLGFLQLLYTPIAMIIAQSILILPIVAALTANLLEHMWEEYRDHWYSFNLSRWQQIWQLIIEARYALVGILLSGLGRSLSEVGAVIIVGGNIANYTRVMTTTIVLETAKGELALALGVGILLVILAVMLNMLLQQFKSKHGKEGIA